MSADVPGNHAPTITLTTTPTGQADGSVYVDITIADADSDIVTVAFGTLEHGSYTYFVGGDPLDDGLVIENIPATPEGLPGQFVYVPDRTRPGVENLVFTVTDASGESASASTEIIVSADVPGNHAPTVTLTSAPTGEADGSVLVTGTVGDTDADTITITLTDPEHGFYTIGGQRLPGGFTATGPSVPGGVTDSFIYTPDPTRPGVEFITLTVTDSSGETASDTIQVLVTTPGGEIDEVTRGAQQADGSFTRSPVST